MQIFNVVAVAAVLAGGCTKYVPVETAKLKAPRECKVRPASELPPIAKIAAAKIGPDGLNKHWARHWRLNARPAYRRLRRYFRVCSVYALRK